MKLTENSLYHFNRVWLAKKIMRDFAESFRGLSRRRLAKQSCQTGPWIIDV